MAAASAEIDNQNYSMDENEDEDDEWTYERDPWSTITDFITRRFKEVQQEARLINETQYAIMAPTIDDDDEDKLPVYVELIVGLSGALDFTPVLKMKNGGIVDKLATVPFTYTEWMEFTSRLQSLSEQYFNNENNCRQDVHLNLFDDLLVRLQVVENKFFLTVSRCGVTVYLDKSVIEEILIRNDMICYKLDMLDKLNFFDYFKQTLQLAVRISYETNGEINYDYLLSTLSEVSNSECLYCMLECMWFMRPRVHSYLDSIKPLN